MIAEDIAYLILTFTLIATFISVFFFTYVSKTEGDIVKSQMDKIVTDLMTDTGAVISASQKAQISQIITQNLKMPDMSQADADTASANNALKNKAAKVFGALILIGLLVIAGLWYKYRFSLMEITKYSFIILILIAATEFLFVSQISRNYQIVDANYVRYLIANRLRTYAQSS